MAKFIDRLNPVLVPLFKSMEFEGDIDSFADLKDFDANSYLLDQLNYCISFDELRFLMALAIGDEDSVLKDLSIYQRFVTLGLINDKGADIDFSHPLINRYYINYVANYRMIGGIAKFKDRRHKK